MYRFNPRDHVTAKDLRELLNGVPDDTPVLMLDGEDEIAHDIYAMGHFTSTKTFPVESGSRINIALIEKGSVVVLSPWEMTLGEYES